MLLEGDQTAFRQGEHCLFCFKKKKKKKKLLLNEVGVSSLKASLDIPWWRFYGLRAVENFLGLIFPEHLRPLGVDTS